MFTVHFCISHHLATHVGALFELLIDMLRVSIGYTHTVLVLLWLSSDS